MLALNNEPTFPTFMSGQLPSRKRQLCPEDYGSISDLIIFLDKFF